MFFSLNQYIGFAIKYKDSYFSAMIYITWWGLFYSTGIRKYHKRHFTVQTYFFDDRFQKKTLQKWMFVLYHDQQFNRLFFLKGIDGRYQFFDLCFVGFYRVCLPVRVQDNNSFLSWCLFCTSARLLVPWVLTYEWSDDAWWYGTRAKPAKPSISLKCHYDFKFSQLFYY